MKWGLMDGNLSEIEAAYERQWQREQEAFESEPVQKCWIFNWEDDED